MGALLLVSLYTLHRIATQSNSGGDGIFTLQRGGTIWLTIAMAVVCVAVGVATVRAAVSWIAAIVAAYLGPGRTRGASAVLSFVFYLVLAIVIAGETQIDLSGIALSGAVTGVIVGIAAQASLSNIVAGMVILFARPYRPGEHVTVRAAAFAGSEYSGEVGEITLFFTTLISQAEEIRVPNSSMVSSVVVLRPQALEVYLPLVLPLARWESLSTTGVVHQLGEALPPGRHLTAGIERLDQASVQIGVRASVADAAERSALERAVLKLLRAAPADDSHERRAAEELHELS